MSSSTVDPIANPEAWDVVTVSGIKSPGHCDLGDVERIYKWDVKEGRGTKGGTRTFVNQPPPSFDITFYLWEQAHFRTWGSFREALKYDPTKKETTAFQIYHPALADLEIKTVCTEKIGAIKDLGAGYYSLTVTFGEYLPPPKASVVSTPTSAADSGDSADDAPDPVIVALQKERDAAALAAQGAWQ